MSVCKNPLLSTKNHVPSSASLLAAASTDGLIDISYGPRDIVLIDGNLPHGITRLSAPKGLTGSRAELERFSLIVFSTFKRADRMLKHGNYSPMWKEGWRDAVL